MKPSFATHYPSTLDLRSAKPCGCPVGVAGVQHRYGCPAFRPFVTGDGQAPESDGARVDPALLALEQIASLRAEVAALKRQVQALQAALGPASFPEPGAAYHVAAGGRAG